MPISVTCGECQKAFRVADEFAGKQGKCPQCMAVIQVPAAESNKEAAVEFEPARPPRDERDDRREPPPRRRDNDEERYDRGPRRRRYADDWDDRDYDRAPVGSWKKVSGAFGMLTTEAIFSLLSRVGFLILILIAISADSYSRRRSTADTLMLIAIASGILLLLGSLFGILGRSAARAVPDWDCKGSAGAGLVLSSITFGLYMITVLVLLIQILGADSRRYRGDDLSGVLAIIGILATIMWAVTELVFGRFLSNVGRATRSPGLRSWGNAITIIYSCYLGWIVLGFLLALMARSEGMAMIISIIFLILDFVAVIMTLIPRLTAKTVTRNAITMDVGRSRYRDDDAGMDEDDAPRRRRRGRDPDDDYDY